MNLLHLGLGYLGAGVGAGICMLGAGWGIGYLSYAALEGTARQPEAAGDLRVTMLIPAALIEGLGFFALVICMMVTLALNTSLQKTTVSSQSAPAAQAR